MKLAEPCGIAYICFAPRHVLGVTRIDQNDLEPVLLTARAYDTPRSLTSFTASSLNSRVNFRLSMTHLLLHKTPNLVSSEPGAAQPAKQTARSTNCFTAMISWLYVGDATMALSNQQSEIKKYVCAECIGDPILREEIRSLNCLRTCTYCENRGLAVSVESLAERVDEVYMLVVGFGEEYPTADPNSDNAIWKNEGVSPSEIIQELIECDSSETAADIAAELSQKEAYGVVKDGDTA